MHGIGEAIARNLLEMSLLKVPIITIVIGEGGFWRRLWSLSVSDRLVMLENSVYSILSPEGFVFYFMERSRRKTCSRGNKFNEINGTRSL